MQLPFSHILARRLTMYSEIVTFLCTVFAWSTAAQTCTVCSERTYLTNCDGFNTGECVSCSNCGPGNYYTDGCSTYALGGSPYDTICDVCPAGKYSDQVHNIACQQCPASKTTLGIGATSVINCVTCPRGYRIDSQYLCEACLPGTYNVGGIICYACPVGSYATNSAASSCLFCARGKYGVLTGQVDNSSCAYDCPLGTFGYNGKCWTCSEGNYASSLASTQCTHCIKGKYQTIKGATSSDCIQCPNGMYNHPSFTPSTCYRCAAGKFNFNLQLNNATFCYSCAPGSYTTALASSTCILCAAGTYSSMPERSSATACLGCAGGTYSSTGAGVCCASGTYSERASTICCPFNSFVLPNTTTCQACPAGSYMASSTSCLSCPVGFYSSSAASASCRSCAYCSSGSYAYACGGNSAGVCTQCTN